MKRISISTALLASLISAYTFADVFHPEDSDVRGHLGYWGDDICFNNDGSTNSANCPLDVRPNEGYVWADSDGWRTSYTGIWWCGDSAVKAVSGATCNFVTVTSILGPCTPDQYVLVKTSLRFRYFALKAGTSCGSIFPSEEEVIYPCLDTDAFDSAIGCHPAKPTAISAKDGYIKLDTIGTPPSTNLDCDDISHEGRMVVDSVNSKLYICTQAGWESFSPDPP